MKGKSAWMAGAAAITLIVSAQAADAKAKHHHHAPAPTSDTSSSSSDSTMASSEQSGPSNAELEARIEALESEMQASEVRQASDHDQIASLPDKLEGWWDDTSISGRMYFDMSWVQQNQDGTRTGTANGTSFDIKRFYVGIDHKFDDVFSADVTTDFTFDSNLGVSQVYIKKAYLQAKLNDAAIFRLGSADMPWIPFMEDIYGFRYVENTLIDREKFGNSADWGVYMLGKLYDGLLNYEFAVVNGAGYKKANIFRTNGPDFEGRVNLNVDHFILGVGGYMGKFGKQFGQPLHHEAVRGDAVAAYVDSDFRLGVEYMYENNFSSVSNVLPEDHATGVSGFGSYTFMPEWTVFGRYDHLTKNVTGAVGIPDDYFNAGIEYNPVKIVDLSLVYKHEQVGHGFLNTTNGTIGGVINGTYDEVGLFGQLRW